jgi:hypothetical protein
MPTKRRRLAARQIGISGPAIAAWRAGDFHGLSRTLGIRPWQPTPWPVRLTALGVDQKPCPVQNGMPLWGSDDYAHAQALQRALIAAAGDPPAQLMEGRSRCRRSGKG